MMPIQATRLAALSDTTCRMVVTAEKAQTMSMRLDIETAKAVYRRAIDAAASDGEGIVWWTGVADELLQVIQAGNTNAAAAVIEWWHHVA